jgi:hypothetical protein
MSLFTALSFYPKSSSDSAQLCNFNAKKRSVRFLGHGIGWRGGIV